MKIITHSVNQRKAVNNSKLYNAINKPIKKKTKKI